MCVKGGGGFSGLLEVHGNILFLSNVCISLKGQIKAFILTVWVFYGLVQENGFWTRSILVKGTFLLIYLLGESVLLVEQCAHNPPSPLN